MSPNISRNLSKLAIAALMIPALAYAEKKPTVVIVHKVQDGTNWQEVASDLARDGYTVVSSSMKDTDTVADEQKDLETVLAGEIGKKVLLVGTDAGTDAVTSFAASEPAQVKGLVYLTSKGAPHMSAALSSVPEFVVRLNDVKQFTEQHEAGLTIYTVPTHNAVANSSDLADAIDRVAHVKSTPVVAALNRPTAADTTQVASLR